ncbi:hypothetical protein Scep_003188 [Stephania cephalantha]|uniref:Dirigent protein n=1 Tax=Stephania cephalantha TaxID=152367 RepID=A0AAP0KSF7_9MAGN
MVMASILSRIVSIDLLPILLFFNIFVDGTKPYYHQKYFSKEKLTHLHFYFHDSMSPTNFTVVQVAAAPRRNGSTAMVNSITEFGSVMISDDPLTETPDPSSKVVGRAQGLSSSVSQSDTTILMAFNLVFTTGKFNGSTISILGRNSIYASKVREMPVVGGSGVFRFARGYVLMKTYALDVKNLRATVEYDVYVWHY